MCPPDLSIKLDAVQTCEWCYHPSPQPLSQLSRDYAITPRTNDNTQLKHAREQSHTRAHLTMSMRAPIARPLSQARKKADRGHKHPRSTAHFFVRAPAVS